MPARKTKTPEEEYTYGRLHEEHSLPLMRKLYHSELYLNPNKYGAFDYHTPDDSCFVELKRRRIRHNAFGDLVVSAFKWVEGFERKANGARVIYVWKCEDGFYAYELGTHEAEEKELPIIPFKRGGRNPSDSVNVPSDWMHKISELEWNGGPFIVDFNEA